MHEQTGWIKLYRSLKDWEWYGDPVVFRVFIHILLSVNHSEKRWRGKTIKRGQMITSIAKLAKEVGQTYKQTRRAIEKLIGTGELASEGANTHTVITVIKFDAYQDFNAEQGERIGEQEGNQRANGGRTEGERRATNNNVKNEENEKKKVQKRNSFVTAEKPDDITPDLWDDFVALRKAKRAPLSQTVVKTLRKEAEKAGVSLSEALEIAVTRGWQGFKADWILKERFPGLSVTERKAAAREDLGHLPF